MLIPAQTVQRERSPVRNTLLGFRATYYIVPHRCIAGGCSNFRKDGVSLHKWPDDDRFAKLWTNAVKNTRSDVFNPTTSRLCSADSAHFTDDFFQEQSVIAKSSCKGMFKRKLKFISINVK